MVKCVSLLGSTGSIGRQSLDIISRMPDIRVCALTAGTNVERMAQQCRDFLPELAVMATQEAAEQLSEAVRELPVRISWGEEGLIEAATMKDADCVIVAVAHNEFKALTLDDIKKLYRVCDDAEKVLVDVKGIYKVSDLNASGVKYWRL